MLNRDEVAALASTSSLPTFTRPLYWSATASTVGANARQGAHQDAQKSIRTGTVDWITSVSKLVSVISTVFCPMSPPRKMTKHLKVAEARRHCQMGRTSAAIKGCGYLEIGNLEI